MNPYVDVVVVASVPDVHAYLDWMLRMVSFEVTWHDDNACTTGTKHSSLAMLNNARWIKAGINLYPGDVGQTVVRITQLAGNTTSIAMTGLFPKAEETLEGLADRVARDFAAQGALTGVYPSPAPPPPGTLPPPPPPAGYEPPRHDPAPPPPPDRPPPPSSR